MAYTTTKTLNVRIKNKYDSYENWAASKVILEAGEIAIAYTTTNVQVDNGKIEKHPALLMKVGDGSSEFANLPWLSAKAADVADWAKAEAKPVYAAGEITGIDAYIAGYVNDKMGISVDTDTQYQIVAGAAANSFKLQSKGKTDTIWADVEGSTFTVDFTAVTGRLTAIEDNIGDYVFAEEFAKYETKGAAAEEAGKVNAALEEYKTANNEAVGANTADISAIKDGKDIDSFADVETALANKAASDHNHNGVYATLAQAQGYADAKDDAITAAQTAGDTAQAGVNALNAKVDLDEGETVTGLIAAAAQEAADAAGDLQDAIDALADRLPEGTVVDYVAGQIKSEEDRAKGVESGLDERITAIAEDYLTSEDKQSLQDQINTIMSNPETKDVVDSINEFTEYITTHGKIADGFRKDIDQNKEDIAAITADYLKAEDKTALNNLIGGLDTRVSDAEGAISGLNTAVGTKAEKSALEALAERLPEGTVVDYVAGQLTPVTQSISTLDGSLKAIAKSGNVDDLVQTANTYVVFDCGTASVNV